MECLRAKNRCFNCKEIGHTSRNCPKKTLVKGSGSKPPGTSTYSMEIMMDLIDDYSGDDEKEINSLSIGCLGYHTEAFCRVPMAPTQYKSWRRNYPMWQSPRISDRRQIEDCYELATTHVLTILQPYPGDEDRFDDLNILGPDSRFIVTNDIINKNVIIYD
jgi:hypothetical protein